MNFRIVKLHYLEINAPINIDQIRYAMPVIASHLPGTRLYFGTDNGIWGSSLDIEISLHEFNKVVRNGFVSPDKSAAGIIINEEFYTIPMAVLEFIREKSIEYNYYAELITPTPPSSPDTEIRFEDAF
jgi:hypothetical protein